METMIARWESRSGKHYVELFYNPEFKLADGRIVIDAHYRAPHAGGGITATSREDAIAKMEARVASGYFQPDANRTPMKRVTLRTSTFVP
jgi:hypothetical protein